MSDQQNSRLSEIRQQSQEFPRKFVSPDVEFSTWEKIKPYCKELLDREINSVNDLEHWMKDESEVSAIIREEENRRYVAMTCATDDKDAEKAFLDFVENIAPKLKPITDQLNRKLIDCEYSGDLDTDRYEVLLRSRRNSIDLFRRENVDLETELEKLSQQYQKIMGAMTVNFRGEERTMQQMSMFFEDTDRETRQEAFDLSVERRLQDTEKLEDIFDNMLKLRHQVAINAGFDNYRDYIFKRIERFDYTPVQCMQFHEAIEKIVVPMHKQAVSERKLSLGVDTIRPWDAACDRYSREPLRPFDDTDVLATVCQSIFEKVDAELGADFQKMIDLGLLDLDSRKGKAPGGYQTTFNELRLPFIFMNAVGINRDIFILLHEGGHAFHTFATRNEPMIEYRSAPIEFSEVASMAMEHLSAPYLTEFYDECDAARALYDHFSGNIGLLPWVAMVDAFQHWIYTNPNHTREERSEFWLELSERYSSGIDHTGYEEFLKNRWHAQLHIFEAPFYYIEYGIALLGALQVWRNSLTDQAGALADYKKGLSLGGSQKLPLLFESAGAKFDFSAETIEPLMKEVQDEMERLKTLEKTS